MKLFETLDGYPRLLAGVHRKPPPLVRPPLLAWHLGFWFVKDAAKPGKTYANTARPKQKENINAYLKTLYLGLRSDRRTGKSFVAGVDQFRTENQAGSVIELFGAAIDEDGNDIPTFKGPIDEDVVTFKFRWWSLVDVTLRFELFTEYLCLSVFIDASTYLSSAGLANGLVKCPVAIFEIFHQLLQLDRRITLDYNLHDDPLTRTKYEAIAETLFFAIWDHVYLSLLSGDLPISQPLGRVFIDFRALVIGKKLEEQAANKVCPFGNFQGPFWRVGHQVHSSIARTAPDADPATWDYWHKRRAEFWPLMTSRVRGVEISEYEIAVSRMLDSRALHMTALGAQPALPPTQERFPTCYFLFTEALNGWQTGRLVHRINQVGTVRQAGLFGLSELRVAAKRIAEAEEKIRAGFALTHQPPGDDAGALSGHVSRLGKRISEAETIVADIDAAVEGDIEHRIERSRLYIEQFHQRLKPLRILRLEGFQPIDVFVESRFGSSFSYIELLAARYQRLRKDLAALSQYYLSQATRHVGLATRNLNGKIADLQEFADFGLWAALVPYYFGTVIGYVLGFTERNPAPWNFWLGWFTACLSVAAIRKFKPGLLWRTLLFAAIAVSAGMIVFAAYSVTIKSHPLHVPKLIRSAHPLGRAQPWPARLSPPDPGG